MNNYPCSHEAWAKYVRAQHPSQLVPAEWISPRRIEAQRRGRKFAMTFGELQRLLEESPASPLKMAELVPDRSADEEDRSLFPVGFAPEEGVSAR
jgi:hypothetical protein